MVHKTQFIYFMINEKLIRKKKCIKTAQRIYIQHQTQNQNEYSLMISQMEKK